MTELHPMRIGSGKPTTDSETVVRAPFDGSELARVPVGGPEHVDAAVAAASEARNRPMPAHERASVLEAAADRMAARHEEFARSIAGEAAKPLKAARVEAARAVGTFRFAAVEARTLAGDMIPMDANDAGIGKLGFTLRVPIGVVGAISPFNFPLNLVAHKVAPAIAAGCPIVLKPASQTPLTALLLASVLLDEAGLPPGWLNVVTGGGGSVGNALVDHEGIAYVTFTGSPEVGWGIKGRAPRKKVGLELGNNAPVIVEPDADLDARGDQDRRRRLRLLRPDLHLGAAGLRARLDPRRVGRPGRGQGRDARGRRPDGRRRPMSRHSSTPENATGSSVGSTRPPEAARRSRPAGPSSTTCSPRPC